MARFEYVKDLASQRIYFYPEEGRPSSAPSVEIKDESGTTIRASATTYVTQNTCNTTVASASSVNDRTITLTAVTGIEVKQTYLITNSIGQKERVRAISVNSSTKAVGLDEPLKYAHDTSATFVGCYFYYTLQTGDVDALGELFRARASYTINSLNYVQEITFDVVLTPLVNPLTVPFIKQRRPDLMAFEPAEMRGTDFEDFRNQAWEEVRKGIRQAGWRPGLVRTPEDVEDWALCEFDYICQHNGIRVIRDSDQLEALRYLKERTIDAKNVSLATIQFYDKNEDDSRSIDEERPQRMMFKR